MEKHQNQSDFDLVKNYFFENKPNCFTSPGASPLSRTLEETLSSPFLVNDMFWTQHPSWGGGWQPGNTQPLHLCTSPAPSSQWPQKVLTLITVQKITLKHSSINSSVLSTVNRDTRGEASCPGEAQWHEQFGNSGDDGFQSSSQTTWPPSLCSKTLLWPVNGTVQSAGV